MQLKTAEMSTMTSLTNLETGSKRGRPDRCRFIPSLSSFESLQAVFNSHDDLGVEASSRQQGKKEGRSGGEDIENSRYIFRQILRNNLFGARSRSLILADDRVNGFNENDWGVMGSGGYNKIDESFVSERQISNTPFKVLDAPNLQDDFYLNVVDWNVHNNLAVGLGQAVYIWNYESNKVRKLTEFFGRNHVTSVAWEPKKNVLGVGSKEGAVSIWDTVAEKPLRKFYDHSERVGAISLFGSLLITGSKDRLILLRDMRSKGSGVETFKAHKQEICGLKWSQDGNYFASGGNDNRLCVFSPKTCHPLFKKTQKAAVKALSWSPRRVGVLASGAGTADRCIKLWNVNSGRLINSHETGSQVCNLAFSKFNDELVSSHGFSENAVCVWESNNFRKIKSLKGHMSRVLYLAMSPCGNYVVSGAGDETLRFWDLNYSGDQVQSGKTQIISESLKKKSKMSNLEPRLVR